MTLAASDFLNTATHKMTSLLARVLSALSAGRWRRGLVGADIGSDIGGFSASEGAASAIVDGDGLIARAPAAMATLFKAGEAATRRGPAAFADLFLPEERARLETVLRISAPTRLTARARRPDGGVGVFDLYLDRLVCAADKSATRRAVLVVDRTDAASEAAALTRATEAARAEARDAAAALADLSHEMKTPLNAVIGFAETIREETFGPVGHPRYAEYAEHIRASGEHLLDLVVSLLDMARIDADRLSLAPVLADPAQLAEECAAMVRGAAESAGLKLIVEAGDNLPECVLDPRAVRQILLNLLSNAVKFTSDGEIRLEARLDEADGNKIVFTVTDTGIGMSAQDLAKLGPRFTHAHGAGVRGADGAGLGLSLAFRLAELHGGGLSLFSSPGEGVRARLELPLDARPFARRQALAGAAGPLSGDASDAAHKAREPQTEHERVLAARVRKSAASARLVDRASAA